jgi:hypothetical protein
MEIIQADKSTTQLNEPAWNGNGFSEPEAQALWVRLPANLRTIASEEIQAGNAVQAVLENRDRGIILVCLSRGPVLFSHVLTGICVHTAQAGGNYCYDGTKATYEDSATGCFLSFEDPDYEWPAF